MAMIVSVLVFLVLLFGAIALYQYVRDHQLKSG